MTDEKKETVDTIEKSKKPDPRLLELEEELSEGDLEEVAGASCGSFTQRETQ